MGVFFLNFKLNPTTFTTTIFWKRILAPSYKYKLNKKVPKNIYFFLKLEDWGKPRFFLSEQSKIFHLQDSAWIVFCLKDTTKKSWVWTLKIKRPFFRGQEQPFCDLTRFFLGLLKKCTKTTVFWHFFEKNGSFYWMEDNAAILALQSKEDRLASVNFNENGRINLDQSSVFSNFNAFRMYVTGSAIRYL